MRTNSSLNLDRRVCFNFSDPCGCLFCGNQKNPPGKLDHVGVEFRVAVGAEAYALRKLTQDTFTSMSAPPGNTKSEVFLGRIDVVCN